MQRPLRWQLSQSGASTEKSGPLLSCAQSRALDEVALARFGLSAAVLMENAGRSLAEAVLDLMLSAVGNRLVPVIVLCGPGNNGGDGLVAARHLSLAGLGVWVVLAFDGKPKLEHNAANLKAAGLCCRSLLRLGGRDENECGGGGEILGNLQEGPAGIVIDAILGTGISRPPSGLSLEAIVLANRLAGRGWMIVAADVPSGIDADSGRPVGPAETAVTADLTVTFAAMKIGLATGRCTQAGDVAVATIGLPRQAVEMIIEAGRQTNSTEH